MSDIENRLREIKIEDYIWIIYLGIIIFSWYSNSLERKYFLNNDINAKNKYREVMIGIFTVLVIVYFYFLYDSYKSIINLDKYVDEEKKKYVILSFIASLLIFISGLIFLYIAIKDNNLDVELAFN